VGQQIGREMVEAREHHHGKAGRAAHGASLAAGR
jgi:hypothetical protein